MRLHNNGLLIADLHIKKDERYAPEGTTDYRLEQQPMMLLDRIEELIPERNIGWLAILGDLLDTSACLPQELHVLDKFLSRMNNWNIPILVILGQHDVDSNRYDGNDTNYFNRSNVTALIEHYNNIHYAHDTYGTINGKYKYWISNFSEPLVYPKEYVDLWLTHCSLGFTHVEEWNTDEKNIKFDRKFGIMAAGDIHEHLNIGNCYSVGTPYQHKAHEQQMGVIGFIKDAGDKLEFSRIPSDTENRRFLRFDPPNKKIVVKDEQGKEIEVDIAQKNILNEIEAKVKELGLDYIHNKISKTGAPNPINFNFKITKLTIENYKSCKYLELDFNTFKKTLFLQGKYGSGKSTIVEALRDVFCGDTKTIDSKVMYGTENCKLQVELEYENKNYMIVRGKSLLEFYINGEQQSANNMKGVEGLMRLALPFISYLYLFLPHSNERLFDPEKGLELFQRCFNLDVFDYYLDNAVKLKKLFNEENNAIFSNVKVKEGERNILQAEVDRVKNNIEESSIKIEDDYDELIKRKRDLGHISNALISLNTSIKNIEDEINDEVVTDHEGYRERKEVEQELKECQDKLVEMRKNEKKKQERALLEKELKNTREQYTLLSKQIKKVDMPKETKDELQLIKQDLEDCKTKSNDKLITLKSSEKNLKEQLNLLDNGILQGDYICPTCKQRVIKDVSDLKKQKEVVEMELTNISKDIEKMIEDSFDTRKKLEEIDSKLSAIDILQSNIEIEQQLKEITNKGQEIKKQFDAIEVSSEDYSIEEQESLMSALKDAISAIDKHEALKKKLTKLKSEKRAIEYTHGNEASINYAIEQIDMKISYHTIYLSYVNELKKKQSKLDECVSKIEELSNEYEAGIKQLTDWDTYISLMDYNNLSSIPYKLINLLITNFNTDSFKISTSRTQKNGKEKFIIDLLIKDENSKYWVPYISQSGGQKLLSDLYLYDSIAKFMGGIGILSLDENLNTASIDLYPLLNDIIGSLNYNNVILVSHSQQISSYDKKITVYLNDRHESCYN